MPQITEIEQLKRENEELRLMVGIAESFPIKVRMECRKLMRSGSFSRDFISMLHDSADRAISKTQGQSLADIKANAVIEIKNTDCGFSVQTSEFEQEWVYSNDDIDTYAETLRGETK